MRRSRFRRTMIWPSWSVAMVAGLLVVLLGCVGNTQAQALAATPATDQSAADASVQKFAQALGGVDMAAVVSNLDFRFVDGQAPTNRMSMQEVAEVLAADAEPAGDLEVGIVPATVFGNAPFDEQYVDKMIGDHHQENGQSFTKKFGDLLYAGDDEIKQHGPASRSTILSSAPPLVNAGFTAGSSQPLNYLAVRVPHDDLNAIHTNNVKTILAGLVSVVASTLLTTMITAFCLGFAPAAAVACPALGSVFGALIGGILGQAIEGKLSDPKAWAVTLGSAALGATVGAALARQWAKKHFADYFQSAGKWVRNSLANKAWFKFLGLTPAIEHSADFMGNMVSDLELYLSTHG